MDSESVGMVSVVTELVDSESVVKVSVGMVLVATELVDLE